MTPALRPVAVEALPVYPLVRGQAAMRLDLLTINVHRIIGSAWMVNSSFEERGIALSLWCHSTGTQDPAGTLPDDDDQLAHLAGLSSDLRRWRRARAGALWGWTPHQVTDEDGAPWRVRLAHPVMTQAALHMVGILEKRGEKRSDERARVARGRLRERMGQMLGREARDAEVSAVDGALAARGVARRSDLAIRGVMEGLGLRIVG